MAGLVKFERKTEEIFEAYVLAQFLMYCRAPGRQTAPGEVVDLGEIGSTAEKNWERLTPYSTAQAR
jgi:hypothetical protein